MTSRAMRVMRWIDGLLVFMIGFLLFVLSEQTDVYFAWTIQSPLMAAWLGAAYWASGVREWLDSREATWANSRAAVPGIITFSTLMLLTTLLHLDRFHFNAPLLMTRLTTWTWLIVYILVPIALALLWAREARLTAVSSPSSDPLPDWVKVVLYGLVALLLILGALLFLVPQSLIPLWPWPLTALTARAMASWLVGIGVVILGTVRTDNIRRSRNNLIFLLALGLLQIVALLRYGGEVAWASPAAWLYLLALAILLVVGGYGAMRVRFVSDAVQL
jgi:hypothetical protein